MTSKGRQLLNLVPEELKSPTLTAEWEQKLKDISKGMLQRETFVNEMRKYAVDVVGKIKASDKTFKHDNITGNRCPVCGKLMLEVNGKNGKMLICQDRECGYRKNVARLTNASALNAIKKWNSAVKAKVRYLYAAAGTGKSFLHLMKERKRKAAA